MVAHRRVLQVYNENETPYGPLNLANADINETELFRKVVVVALNVCAAATVGCP